MKPCWNSLGTSFFRNVHLKPVEEECTVENPMYMKLLRLMLYNHGVHNVCNSVRFFFWWKQKKGSLFSFLHRIVSNDIKSMWLCDRITYKPKTKPKPNHIYTRIASGLNFFSVKEKEDKFRLFLLLVLCNNNM